MSRNEVMALKDSALNLKKADKVTTTIMNKTEKIEEAKVQLDNRLHNKPLKHINDISRKWLSKLPIHLERQYSISSRKYKLIPVGNHIISGCYGPTEKISSFVEILL